MESPKQSSQDRSSKFGSHNHLEDSHPPENPKKGLITPLYVLIALLCTYGLLMLIMAFFPADGLKINESITLEFPTLAEFFEADTVQKKDISAILENLASADTIASDTVEEAGPDLSKRSDSLRKMALQLQYKNNNPAALAGFFAALENLAKNPKTIRVLHFGDSQLEGDRMTSLIRARLQSRFGGIGPGLVAPVNIAPSFSVDQEVSENWVRYPGYGKRDTSVHHKRYGVLAAFCRFSPVNVDTFTKESEEYEAWVRFKRAGRAYAGAKEYSRIRLLYGNNRQPVHVKAFADGVLLGEDDLPAGNVLKTYSWEFASTPGEVTLYFNGKDSPDVYGFSLEGNTGVDVDNIAMRGGSGTVFGAMDYATLSGCINVLNTKMIILQYGGNTVPYIADRDHAFRYGRSLGSQIKLLRKMVPDASFIVIGPADMSVNEKGEMVTHPQVENVRDAVRQAAFENDAAFFDIYEAMGGRNSMAAWVEADPPLAAPDYIHFSPPGAKEIAETFVRALLRDFDAWKKTAPQPSKIAPDKKKTSENIKTMLPVNPSKTQPAVSAPI